MIGHLRAVTAEELRKLKRDPDSIQTFLRGNKNADSGDAKAALLRLQEIAKQAKAAGRTIDPIENEKVREQILKELESEMVKRPSAGVKAEGLSLEKSWHSLHYLLTGSAGETNLTLGKTILGGKELGPDIGYGPARFLEPPEVKEVATALKEVSEVELEKRFDLPAMLAANVYACRDESELKLAQHYFAQVVRYYSEAAHRGRAMLLYLD
jgi:hypothetical protein